MLNLECTSVEGDQYKSELKMSRNLNLDDYEYVEEPIWEDLGTTMEEHHRKGRTKEIERTLLSLSISTEEHIIEVVII